MKATTSAEAGAAPRAAATPKPRPAARAAKAPARPHLRVIPGTDRWTALRDSDRVRWQRVMSAQARIATGYYDREDVREVLVDAVLEELSKH